MADPRKSMIWVLGLINVDLLITDNHIHELMPFSSHLIDLCFMVFISSNNLNSYDILEVYQLVSANMHICMIDT